MKTICRKRTILQKGEDEVVFQDSCMSDDFW